MTASPQKEWLEPNYLGGFASSTITGIPTRRYHGLLIAQDPNRSERFMLLNALEVFFEDAAGERFALSSFEFGGNIISPDGYSRIHSFTQEPWPTWVYQLSGKTEVKFELCAAHEKNEIACRWTLTPRAKGKLYVRPLISGRNYHALHAANSDFNFSLFSEKNYRAVRPYPGIPALAVQSAAELLPDAQWYYNFRYGEEAARGFPHREDLASPGFFVADLAKGAASMTWAARFDGDSSALCAAEDIFKKETKRRAGYVDVLHKNADAYIVRRGTGRTIIAGYPWFLDWGRDTFISIRGLCLATQRYDVAEDILLQWATHISEGMIPNRIADVGSHGEYNSVDASLWYMLVIYEFLTQTNAKAHKVGTATQKTLNEVLSSIMAAFYHGTRYGIRCDEIDGLLACGERGSQLTWMDAKVGDYAVTPRIGKPVEIQCLWIHALKIAATLLDASWEARHQLALSSFQRKFWNAERDCLYDVIDCDHEKNQVDALIRPNQIFAVGGLPMQLLPLPKAQAVVRTVETHLITPMGPRSLAPGEPGYRGRYEGGPHERDISYHQGTVWPWVMGAFIEAWVRVKGGEKKSKDEARARFLDPLLAHTNTLGLGHLAEIADAEAPFRSRGCPFQAWSVAEALRASLQILR